MSISSSQKMLLVIVLAFACVFSSGADAWSWSWSSGFSDPGSGWSWGWGSDRSNRPGLGSGSNSDGSSWSWNWNSRSGWSWNSRSGWKWNSGSNHNEAQRKVVVGGSDGWTNGSDLQGWVTKNAPFYVNDVLVFKYDNSTKQRHDVYLFPNVWNYMRCNIRSGNKIASTTNNGTRDSFEFTLEKSHPYFFACGEHNGDYCSNDNMKFVVIPIY